MIPRADQSDYFLKTSEFSELVSASFHGKKNAICWERHPEGNFEEIVSLLQDQDNITEISTKDLRALQLSPAGHAAREFILQDHAALTSYGAAPVLNIIRYYERDQEQLFFPTDVYSWHVDRSPFANDTFLCTYSGDSSEILPNEQAEKKILVPEIRVELRKLFKGPDAQFDDFLSEHFFDLHYQALPGASPISLGIGNMWRLATEHPGSPVLPCIHRAPMERSGKARLLLIC